MTRRTRASSSKEASSSLANEISSDSFAVISSLPSKMSSKSIVKTINLLGLPEGCLLPKTHPRECFFHFSPRPGLMFIHDKPSSYGAWKNRFFFVRKAEWEVPLIWRSSLNDLPSINFELVKERVKAAGLLDHGFKAKALVEEDLLILAGLHLVPDTYNRT
ncbi:hypothetical protein Salat_1136900 [Sesamum alatum]|uniref:Uncharacterized protein n=1 Tax=Sesamum alatum TaxID=300844 RepID=A0AAE2CN74_9LAMI|nr:hypothetical protein Salat_1136900 [Sesamum alatum]